MYWFYKVVFLCVCKYSIISRNNASISNFGGGFRWQNKYPWCILKVKRKNFQNKRWRKTSFRPKSIVLYGCNSKTNHCKYLKFSKYFDIFWATYRQWIFQFFWECFFEVSIKLVWLSQNHEYLKIIL